jgi:hypothetical protein
MQKSLKSTFKRILKKYVIISEMLLRIIIIKLMDKQKPYSPEKNFIKKQTNWPFFFWFQAVLWTVFTWSVRASTPDNGIFIHYGVRQRLCCTQKKPRKSGNSVLWSAQSLPTNFLLETIWNNLEKKYLAEICLTLDFFAGVFFVGKFLNKEYFLQSKIRKKKILSRKLVCQKVQCP